MLGYKESDINRMIRAVEMAKKQLNPNMLTSNETSDTLDKVIDLLEGLLAEGHIQ